MGQISRILVIDGNRAITKQLKELLEYEKYDVETAGDTAETDKIVKSQKPFHLIICESGMVLTTGKPVFEYLLETFPMSNMIVLAQDPAVDWVIDIMRKGVYDVICKPISNPNKLFTDIREIASANKPVSDEAPKAAQHRMVEKKPKTLMSSEPLIVGDSMAAKRLKDMINIVAPSDARVLILGENGTGKELVARSIHARSKRCEMPMVNVNCAAIPSDLIESELFGHEKGSFTSAVSQRKGKFEMAHGGTLFLDEIGDMSLSVQSKLLRALQENRITRVGGEKDFDIDVRVLAATNKNLMEEIANRNFREDLYHRLNVVSIIVPPLRERREDIPLLVETFIRDICHSYKREPLDITDPALSILIARPWSGNIRELHNIVERLVLFSNGTITEREVNVYVEGKWD